MAGGAACIATACGGLLALRLERILPSLLAFGSGVVLGVAFLDLLPEALRVGATCIEPVGTIVTALLGFAAYHLFGHLVHARRPDGTGSWPSVVTLVIHSLLDGVGIGSAFRAAQSVGLLVALGVIGHDLVDGSNTVVFSLTAWRSRRLALVWLTLDVLAPLAGVLLSGAIRTNDLALASVLALMAGGFAALGTGQLIAGVRSQPPVRTLALALVGLGFVVLVGWLGAR